MYPILLRVAALAALVLAMLLPLAAHAAETAAVVQTWWQALLVNVVEVATAILIPVLGTLAVVVARRFGFKIEQDQAEKIAAQAVGYAEQKAKSALKDGNAKSTGAERMDMAVRFARQTAARYKLSSRATDKLSDLIEAELGKKIGNGG